QTLYHAPELTILNVVWGPRMTIMPHNHLMWAVIGIYTGREDNIFWRRLPGETGGKIEAAGAKSLGERDAEPLGRDIIHTVTNPLSRMTGAIHVYGGDFLVVSRSEWDAGMDADAARRSGFDPRDFDLGHKLRLVDGEHDVFGDGSVVCLPTHGHTPGHQSLKLRLAGGEVVLAADSCYFCRTLRERRLPRFAHDHEAMHASLDRLAALEAAGARIFFG